MSALLRFHAVRCERGGRILFDDLSLSVGPGDALLVRGPNGSGKSSLLRLAAGLLTPVAGSIARTPLALADSAPALDAELPLARAMRFWLGENAAAALDALGLGALARVPVRHLSTGQAKRAGLARVAGSRAPLWLLDEPLNGLDARSVALVEDLIAKHRANGGAVVAASHMPLSGDWSRLELGA